MSEEKRPTGHPTASSLDRISFCPGSWLLEQQVVITDEATAPDKTLGLRVHAALAGELPEEELTAEEQDVFDECRALTHSLVGDRILDHEGVDRERRLYLKDETGRTICSGRYDLALRFKPAGTLIIDYKTGRGSVQSAERNWQLRALSVLWNINHPDHRGESIEVAIIQPHAAPTVTASVYDAEDLDRSYRLLVGMLKLAADPNAPRRPSEEACRYCKAKAICPEARQQLTALVALDAQRQLEPQEAAFLLSRCELAERIIEAIRTQAKAILASGTAIPGWSLKPGQARETITDLPTVFTRYMEMGGDKAQFTRACSLAKTRLSGLLRGMGLKGVGIDLAMNALLDGCTETRVTEPSLVRDK